MTNLLTFYGSCGHIVIEEVPYEEWLQAAEYNYSILCDASPVRMVYVHPSRFFLCLDCTEEETYCDEFATLRFFFNSSQLAERKTQTLTLGKNMLPSFSDEKILKIATRKVG